VWPGVRQAGLVKAEPGADAGRSNWLNSAAQRGDYYAQHRDRFGYPASSALRTWWGSLAVPVADRCELPDQLAADTTVNWGI
jgi:hypothetical protein